MLLLMVRFLPLARYWGNGEGGGPGGGRGGRVRGSHEYGGRSFAPEYPLRASSSSSESLQLAGNSASNDSDGRGGAPEVQGLNAPRAIRSWTQCRARILVRIPLRVRHGIRWAVQPLKLFMLRVQRADRTGKHLRNRGSESHRCCIYLAQLDLYPGSTLPPPHSPRTTFGLNTDHRCGG